MRGDLDEMRRALDDLEASEPVGVDMNDDHLAAWRLDVHGNPVGEPQRFFYDLTGPTHHRDAQIRHALTRLLHHTRRCGAAVPQSSGRSKARRFRPKYSDS